MTSASVEDLWGTLDRRALAAIVEAGPPALFATISGAHLYGFASADSDVDLRGAFVLPVRDLLGLDLPDETWSVTEVRGGLELDWVAHDGVDATDDLVVPAGLRCPTAEIPMGRSR